jgi:outer membrane protein
MNRCATIGLYCALAAAAAETKVAIIDLQGAILSTQEGQKAAGELEKQFELKKSQLQVRQDHIQALQNQLRKGEAALSAEAKAKLARDIRNATTSLNRDAEDLNTEMQDEHQRLVESLGAKLLGIIEKYATSQGYAVVLDVSGGQQSVAWAARSANITDEVVKQYDRTYLATHQTR